MKTKKIRLFLFAIITLAFILRFWSYEQRYGIGYDGSRDAIVSFESQRLLQLPLTGSFSSIGPITFGPWYYYYLTFANFVIPSVWAPWMAIGLASTAMAFVMYKIGSLLLDSNFGLLLAFVTALSPAQISASTSLQQHALIGLLSSVVIYLFLKINQKDKSPKLSALWGFLSGVAINTHFQATGLLTLPMVLFLFSKKKKFIFNFVLGFFISMIPILTFELNNHWFNTRNIIDYIFIGQYRVWTSNRWLTFLGKFWPDFWSYALGIPFVASFSAMLACALILPIRFIKKKLPQPIMLLSFSFIIQVILLRYYRGEKFFGYLQFFHPFMFIYTGYLLYLLIKKINNKPATVIILILYLIMVFPQSLSYLAPDKFNLESTARLNLLTKKFPGQKFSTYECKNVYDTNRIQGLVLLLYMNKKYEDQGRKIAIYNPACNYYQNDAFGGDLVDVTSIPEEKLQSGGLVQMTPLAIYTGTARWWFKEQP